MRENALCCPCPLMELYEHHSPGINNKMGERRTVNLTKAPFSSLLLEGIALSASTQKVVVMLCPFLLIPSSVSEKWYSTVARQNNKEQSKSVVLSFFLPTYYNSGTYFLH